ncbi:MAG: translation initiation factor IF-3 [Arcanobacterium sp.]|nr:translation initiation factor IF-3 [Arcanobacterium sp.]MDY5588659.1 translation initiation factor IF-3 [Arcanobacterium sp.]
MNDRIRVPEVRLVGPSGEQVGIVRVNDALHLAEEANLDLVEVAPNAKPPVAKLMDYGKYKYEQAQKAREARRNQVNTQIKEIRIGLKIDQHDYETKLKAMMKFLDAGDKVKVQLKFRGREQSRPEMGLHLMRRIAEDAAENGVVESAPRVDGRSMVMVVAPIRRKSQAKSDQRRRREAQRDAERAAAQQAKREAKAAAAEKNEEDAAGQQEGA